MQYLIFIIMVTLILFYLILILLIIYYNKRTIEHMNGERFIYIGNNSWYSNFIKKIMHSYKILDIDQSNASSNDIIVYCNQKDFTQINAFKIFVDGEPDSLVNLEADIIITTKYEKKLLPNFKNQQIIYIPLYSLTFSECNLSPYLLLNKKIHVKTKFCAYANSNCNKNSSGVKLREEFFDILNKYHKVDVLGRCHGYTKIEDINMIKKAYKTTQINENWISRNIKLYEPYKFVIAFENNPIDGYISEKIIIPMLAGAIPIYYGSKDVAEHFNINSIINARDYFSMHDLALDVLDLHNNNSRYQKKIKEPWLFKLTDKFSWYTDNNFYKKLAIKF